MGRAVPGLISWRIHMNKKITGALILAVMLISMAGLGMALSRNQAPVQFESSSEISNDIAGLEEDSANISGEDSPLPGIADEAEMTDTYGSPENYEKENKKIADVADDGTEQKPSGSEKTNTNTQASAEPQTSVSTEASRSGKVSSSQYCLLSKNQGIYGQFAYRNTSGGRIEVDPQWIAENIITITLPGLNKQVRVHKAARDEFIKAFTLIKNGSVTIDGKRVPLLSLVKSMDGTFVTRHVNWNASSGLSNHSWGIAIDINASDHYRYVNPSREPNDPNLILWENAFKPAGFSWGNSYSDAMHFELLD